MRKKHSTKNIITIISKQHFLLCWENILQSSPKLEFYKSIKQNFNAESYLTFVTNYYHRSSLTKLRISAHKLNVETGRYKCIQREERYCSWCKLVMGKCIVENEYHLINVCDFYTKLRIDLVKIIKSATKPLADNINLANFLIESKVNNDIYKIVICKLACFIEKCFASRKKLMDSFDKKPLGLDPNIQHSHTQQDSRYVNNTVPHNFAKAKDSLRKRDRKKHVKFEYMEIPFNPHDPSSRGSLVGYARVVDFMNSPCANLLNDHLKALGFAVNPVLNNDQKDVSCGYNAARVAAKFANYEDDWFNQSVSDCCYSTHNVDPRLNFVAQGNIFLKISTPNTGFEKITKKPIFLTDNQCTKLFHFYSNLYYNQVYNDSDHRSTFASIGIGQSMFKHSILRHFYNLKVLQGSGCPLKIVFVNTLDELPGVHWFLVAFQLFEG